MKHSESLAALAPALVKAQSEFPTIERKTDGQVGSRHYKYADLKDVLSAVKPILEKNGLAIVQLPDVDEHGIMVLSTTILHASGEFLSGDFDLGVSRESQILGSAITYARRYSLSGSLNLATEDDDDGAKASEGGQGSRSQTFRDPAASGPKPGHPTVDEERILAAAAADPSVSFLQSLAQGFAKYGSLTANQVSSGLEAASKVLDRVGASVAGASDPEERPWE